MMNALVPFGPWGYGSLEIRANIRSTPMCFPGGRGEPKPSLITGDRPSKRGTGQPQRPVSCTIVAGCGTASSPGYFGAGVVICGGVVAGGVPTGIGIEPCGVWRIGICRGGATPVLVGVDGA